jgi:hypothetical protein
MSHLRRVGAFVQMSEKIGCHTLFYGVPLEEGGASSVLLERSDAVRCSTMSHLRKVGHLCTWGEGRTWYVVLLWPTWGRWGIHAVVRFNCHRMMNREDRNVTCLCQNCIWLCNVYVYYVTGDPRVVTHLIVYCVLRLNNDYLISWLVLIFENSYILWWNN